MVLMMRRMLSAMTVVAALAGPALAADLKAGLADVFGPPGEWNAAAFRGLKKGRTWDEAKKALPELPPLKAGSSPKLQVPMKGHPLLSGLEVSFMEGKTYTATLVFRSNLDRAAFKAASLELMEAKWAKAKPAERDKDLITLADGASGLLVQRNWLVDHWEIEVELAP
jgi:hypothetical protein